VETLTFEGEVFVSLGKLWFDALISSINSLANCN